MQYREDIQGLRAIAVLFVFIFHLNSNWLPGGFIGVDVFFIISGYLISTIILTKIDKKSFSFMDFYSSRIKRIVPAYYFLLVATILVGLFIIIPSEVSIFRKSLFWSTIFNSNNYFSTLDTYFGTANIENPLLHTWTLAIEMQFYFFLPIILIFVKRKFLLPVIITLITVLFSYSSFEIYVNKNQQVMYYSLLSRSPEFLMGVLISIIQYKKKEYYTKYSLPINIIGLTLLISSAFFINENSSFPGVLAIIPCLGTGLLILYPNPFIQNLLSTKFITYIGTLSYSIYLWHWPIMAFIRYYYNIIDFTTLQYLVVIILTITFSIFSYYIIENPIRKMSSKRCFAYIGTFIFIIGSSILVIPHISKKISPIPLEYIMPTFGLDSHGSSFKNIGIYGDTTISNSGILLIGDSHASNMSCCLDYIAQKNNFTFNKITNTSYPLIPGITQEVLGKNGHSGFVLYQKLIEHADKEIKKSKLIILQVYGRDYDKWGKYICDLVDELDNDQYFILLSDFPALSKNPVRENRDYVKNTERENIYEITWYHPTKQIINCIEANKNAFYLDLSNTNIFDTAPFYKDTIMYYDAHHINTFGAKIYAKDSENKILDILSQIHSNKINNQ